MEKELLVISRMKDGAEASKRQRSSTALEEDVVEHQEQPIVTKKKKTNRKITSFLKKNSTKGEVVDLTSPQPPLKKVFDLTNEEIPTQSNLITIDESPIRQSLTKKKKQITLFGMLSPKKNNQQSTPKRSRVPAVTIIERSPATKKKIATPFLFWNTKKQTPSKLVPVEKSSKKKWASSITSQFVDVKPLLIQEDRLKIPLILEEEEEKESNQGNDDHQELEEFFQQRHPLLPTRESFLKDKNLYYYTHSLPTLENPNPQLPHKQLTPEYIYSYCQHYFVHDALPNLEQFQFQFQALSKRAESANPQLSLYERFTPHSMDELVGETESDNFVASPYGFPVSKSLDDLLDHLKHYRKRHPLVAIVGNSCKTVHLHAILRQLHYHPHEINAQMKRTKTFILKSEEATQSHTCKALLSPHKGTRTCLIFEDLESDLFTGTEESEFYDALSILVRVSKRPLFMVVPPTAYGAMHWLKRQFKAENVPFVYQAPQSYGQSFLFFASVASLTTSLSLDIMYRCFRSYNYDARAALHHIEFDPFCTDLPDTTPISAYSRDHRQEYDTILGKLTKTPTPSVLDTVYRIGLSEHARYQNCNRRRFFHYFLDDLDAPETTRLLHRGAQRFSIM